MLTHCSEEQLILWEKKNIYLHKLSNVRFLLASQSEPGVSLPQLAVIEIYDFTLNFNREFTHSSVIYVHLGREHIFVIVVMYRLKFSKRNMPISMFRSPDLLEQSLIAYCITELLVCFILFANCHHRSVIDSRIYQVFPFWGCNRPSFFKPHYESKAKCKPSYVKLYTKARFHNEVQVTRKWNSKIINLIL